MDKIQMVDLHGQYLDIKLEIDNAINDVLESASFVKGKKVSEFQQDLERYLDVKHVIPVGNGTDALQIALMSLGLQPGDEVITPAFTFVSTVEVIALLGLKPILVDVNYDTFNISINEIKKAITNRTKAIIPVHLFGQNVQMEELLQLASKHQIYVIEDACQSIGAQCLLSSGEIKQSGCMGRVGCTSFFPSKNLGCYGDGGAIYTNDDELALKIRAIANHGMKERYYYDSVGVNSRLDTIQAAILQVKLKYLDQYIQKRQQAASYYDKILGDNKEITIPQRVSYSTHVFHQYTIKMNNTDRALMCEYLEKKGIPAMIYYPVPLHLQNAYTYLGYKKGDFSVSEQLSQSVLSLPMHTELSERQLEYITKNILDFFN